MCACSSPLLIPCPPRCPLEMLSVCSELVDVRSVSEEVGRLAGGVSEKLRTGKSLLICEADNEDRENADGEAEATAELMIGESFKKLDAALAKAIAGSIIDGVCADAAVRKLSMPGSKSPYMESYGCVDGETADGDIAST